jgi:glycosyltransferase involved in cell wall biosynthesis
MSKLSVIIPSYGDGINVLALLRQIGRQPDTEVIVVESAPTTYFDEAKRILPQVRLTSGPKGRGKQMNMGANKSTGDLLWFVHADSDISHITLSNLRLLKNEIWGCFTLQFDNKSPYLRAVEANSNLRARFFQTIYGDQGLFVSRSLFENVGGFHDPFEDINISRKLKKIQPNIVIDEPIITSARSFFKHGPLFTHVMMGAIVVAYAFGLLSLSKAFYRLIK